LTLPPVRQERPDIARRQRRETGQPDRSAEVGFEEGEIAAHRRAIGFDRARAAAALMRQVLKEGGQRLGRRD